LRNNYQPINGYVWRPYEYGTIENPQRLIGLIKHRRNAMRWMVLRVSEVKGEAEELIKTIEERY